MKKIIMICLFLLTGLTYNSLAQGPGGKDFGFGIILGDPTGASAKYWTNYENAFAFSLGASYFGSPRIGVDYLWHFDAFHSNIVELYAGPGGVIGIGKGRGFYYKDKFEDDDRDIGLGVRGVFGINVIPRDVPLETFLEFGVLLALTPDFGSSADVAIGVRFYP